MFNSRSGRFNPFNRQNGNAPQGPDQAAYGPQNPPSFSGGPGYGPQPQQGYDPRLGPVPPQQGYGPTQPQHNYGPQQSPYPPQQGHGGHYGPNPSHSTAMTGPIHTEEEYYDQPHLSRGQPGHNQQQPRQRQNFGSRDQFPQMKNNSPQGQEDLRGLSFWREDEDSAYQDDPEAATDRPSPLKFIFAITGLVLISGVSWLIYRWATQPSNNMLPLIPAEQGPYKVRPENPGGMVIPHQDKLIYGRLTPGGEQQVERLLPPQDNSYYQQPQQGFDPNQAQQPMMDPSQQQMQAAPMQMPQQQQMMTPEQQAYQQQLIAQQQQLAAQQQQQQAQAQALAQQQAVLQAQAAQQQKPQHVAPAVPAPAAKTDDKKAEKKTEDSTKTEGRKPTSATAHTAVEAKPIKAEAEPVEKTDKPAKEGKTETQSKPPVGFYMQLGSLPNEALAKTEWDRLRKKFSAELGEHTAFIRPTEGAAKKLHRVLVGPFSNRNAALQKCVKIGGGCKVVQVG